MEDKIMAIAENLINVHRLEQELDDKEYWINKAAKEAGFVPAENDWIHVDVTFFKVVISVYHQQYEGSVYWVNGVWTTDPHSFNYPSYEKMLCGK